ncbi:arylsulfatase A [Apiospora arundinis]
MAASITAAPSTTTDGLPTQITPFSFNAPGHPCRLSVYCPFLSYYAYIKRPHQLAQQICQGVQTGREFGTSLIRREDCYPGGYLNTIFPGEYLGPYYPNEGPTNEGDRSTLAYPGTACLSGWTTACTTTLDHEGDLFSQAWCCPPGGWSCATRTGISDRAAPQRLCQSPLSTSTTIWMTWDPAYTLSGESQYTWIATITSEEPQNAATVFHKVFPLQLTTGVENTVTDGQGLPSDAADNRDNNPQQSFQGGIAVGSSVVVLCIVFGIILLFRRRRWAARSPETYSAIQQQQSPQQQYSWEGKPELEGSMMVVRPKSELDTIDAARESTALNASVSDLGALSPSTLRGGEAFPSPESRHSRVFEMQG